ncbi:transcription factor jumonji jmjC domain-containing protein [Scytonema sp. UIC 10036]|uniref:cupin domain-containing protein n=1 Tax=Scytonema sp. UIC 10036 TaxID=2304196 RepID=UPI0012DABAB5|nr:cupin domain-containing protein [Scytonema sp. UIC 10036]MUH01083.1 transcription factor jumonji jmjC domain-containing protein [Scytonema sp. UIC 10036]
MKTLQQLLAPYPTDEFLAENWTQKAIHICAGDSQKFKTFFSWNDLNYLLNYHRLTEPDLRFSMNGKSLPQTRNPQDWSALVRQGATLIVNGVHHRVPTVAQLAANLRHDIGYETHINLYCSPAQQQGFDCHYDTHDVLILQIDGEKQWFVYRETVLYPISDMVSSKERQPQEPPYLECVLKAGDLLYIPRGHWHYAVACEHPSLHLTVGIECQTGLDWLSWLMRDLLQQNPSWRQSLPATIDGDTNATQQQLDALRLHLIETLHQPDILCKYIESLTYRNQPRLPVTLPAQIGTDIFQYGFMTQFAWSPLHRIRVKQIGSEHYQVLVGSKQIDLKGVPVILVENLFNRDEFSLYDIADWAPEMDFEGDIAPLITRFITEGILQVKTDPPLS